MSTRHDMTCTKHPIGTIRMEVAPAGGEEDEPVFFHAGAFPAAFEGDEELELKARILAVRARFGKPTKTLAAEMTRRPRVQEGSDQG